MVRGYRDYPESLSREGHCRPLFLVKSAVEQLFNACNRVQDLTTRTAVTPTLRFERLRRDG